MDKKNNGKNEFTRNLNDLLYSKGMSRKDLAEKLKVPYTTVCSWCQGKNYPRMDKVELMAAIFNVPKSRLVDSYDVVPDGYYFLNGDEQFLIEVFSKFPAEEKNRLLEYFKYWLKVNSVEGD